GVVCGGGSLGTCAGARGAGEHGIAYRHIIGSLVRKPGAFARYRYREELFPSLTFRQAFDALGVTHGERADVEYVRVLHLAATTGEREVEATLQALLDDRHPFDYARVQALVTPAMPQIPALQLPVPDLAHYDALLVGGGRCGPRCPRHRPTD